MAMPRVKADLSEGTTSGWERLCETEARAAALRCAEAFRRSATDPAASGPLSHTDFLHRFINSFQQTFEDQIRQYSHLNGYATSVVATAAGLEPPRHAGPPAGRTLRERLGSLKSTLRRGRAVLLRQRSDELDVSPSRRRRGRLAKMVVEIKHEGTVNYLTGDNLEAWRRCRLALVRTGAGHLLEFFTPPKAVRPKSGVFCFLITEARETTALEMPDRENTFVLRAESGLEYVVETSGAHQMSTWLAAIRASMDRPYTDGDLPSSSRSVTHSLALSDGAVLDGPPELHSGGAVPPLHATADNDALSAQW
ncbi:SH2B adapter protein 2-like [Amphibalanus amphitrite]|uniref:SH2B adapter protein 2-like n=1 Tax=Amphibalanus amphitrite TaxID=1232801 RepID=UPI001C90CAA0|nr:SH2B adapter protein 2-like [Amphibalanus amphitrite]XP_043234146.1 SH2B adapter protein 2-like [Amphibalanus amphitrite]